MAPRPSPNLMPGKPHLAIVRPAVDLWHIQRLASWSGDK